jgi:hypothetical protein
MLYTPAYGFLWSVDNFGATYSTAAFGTVVPQDTAANTKGADVELIADSAVTENCYGIAIVFMSNNTSAAIRNYLVDIKVDPAGGTSYVTVIPNLVSHSNAATAGGFWYYFPLFIPAGSAVAASSQCQVGSGTAGSQPRMAVRLFGKPTHPEVMKYGSFVRAFGADTGNSRGTTITPGTTAMGAYTASLATTAEDLWWWQGGLVSSDATMSDNALYLDIAAGDATNKILCAHHITHVTRAAENASKEAFGAVPPILPIAAGANVYARAASAGTPDSTNTVVAYGLGG